MGLGFAAAMLLTPITALAESTTDTSVSKSKTATNLNSDFISEVTLAIPAQSYKGDLDVAFVMDGSTSTDMPKIGSETAALIDVLAGMTNLNIKVSVSIFGGTDVNKNTGEPLSVILNDDRTTALLSLSDSDNVELLKTMVTDQNYKIKDNRSGSNLQAGIKRAEDELAKDTEVAKENKYIIILSDMAARMWINGNGTTVTNVFKIGSNRQWNSNSDQHEMNRYTDETVKSFDQVWKEIKEDGFNIDQYAASYADRESITAAESSTVKDTTPGAYYTCMESAAYHAAEEILNAKNAANVMMVTYPYSNKKYFRIFRQRL